MDVVEPLKLDVAVAAAYIDIAHGTKWIPKHGALTLRCSPCMPAFLLVSWPPNSHKLQLRYCFQVSVHTNHNFDASGCKFTRPIQGSVAASRSLPFMLHGPDILCNLEP